MGRWIENKLGDVCILKTGNSKSKFLVEGGKYLVMDMGAVSEDGRNISYKKTNVSKDMIKEGELVMPKDDIGGGLIIGKVSCILEDDKYVLSDHVYKLTSLKIDGIYLQYLINSYFVNSGIKQCMTGSAQLGISKGSVERQDLYYPESLDEQRKIAEILSTIDDAIEITQALIDKHELIKEGMMHDLFTRGIDPATGSLRPHPSDAPELYKESELGLIPKEWEVKSSSDFCNSIADGTHDSPKPSNTGMILITSKNLTKEGELDESECYLISKKDYLKVVERSYTEKGDILFGLIGTIGNPVILNKGGYATKNVGIFRFNGSAHKSLFFYYYLGTKYIQHQIDSVLNGSTQKFLGLGTIRSFHILNPGDDLIEISEINNILSSIDSKIKLLNQNKQKLILQKQGLMNDLLSGKVRVI